MSRFSSRLPAEITPNAIARRLEERRADDAALLDLTASNPTRVGLPVPTDDVVAALADPRAALYEPTPRGLPAARQAVADYYHTRRLAVDPARLLLTASTSEAYAFLFKLLADSGDELAVPRPSYPLFDFLANLEGVRLRPYALEYDGAWTIDLDSLRHAVGPRTRGLLVVSPNNPTGSFLKRDEREAIVQLAAAHDLALIADEVFADYAFAADPRRTVSLVDEQRVLTFCLSGLSKVAGLPQLKLAWIHVSGPEAVRQRAEERLELIADTYLSVSAPVQHGAAALLALRDSFGGAIFDRVLENHRAVAAAVRGTPVDLLHAEGGWYAVLRVPRTRSEERWVLELLDLDGVLVQPGYFYDFPEEAHLVVSLLVRPDVMAEGVRRIVHRASAR